MGLIKSRFRLFRHDSRSISTCFNCFSLRSIRLNSGQIVPVRRESNRVNANLRKNKNKKFRRGTDARAAAMDAAPCVGLRYSTLSAAFVLHRLKLLSLSLSPLADVFRSSVSYCQTVKPNMLWSLYKHSKFPIINTQFYNMVDEDLKPNVGSQL